jgi:hypothetical protein
VSPARGISRRCWRAVIHRLSPGLELSTALSTGCPQVGDNHDSGLSTAYAQVVHRRRWPPERGTLTRSPRDQGLAVARSGFGLPKIR